MLKQIWASDLFLFWWSSAAVTVFLCIIQHYIASGSSVKLQTLKGSDLWLDQKS